MGHSAVYFSRVTTPSQDSRVQRSSGGPSHQASHPATALGGPGAPATAAAATEEAAGARGGGAAAGCWAAVCGAVDQLIVWGNREPILTLRWALWLLTAGLPLALAYLAAALGMAGTLLFAPFALQALRLARFALDGGITLEPVPLTQLNYAPFGPQGGSFWNRPTHPYTLAANVTWAVLFGWGLCVLRLTAALVQALTVVGLGTALVNVRLCAYTIWPFGRGLRRCQLPTTLEELHAAREAAEAEGTPLLLQYV